jgi:hypothetical protein
MITPPAMATINRMIPTISSMDTYVPRIQHLKQRTVRSPECPVGAKTVPPLARKRNSDRACGAGLPEPSGSVQRCVRGFECECGDLARWSPRYVSGDTFGGELAERWHGLRRHSVAPRNDTQDRGRAGWPGAPCPATPRPRRPRSVAVPVGGNQTAVAMTIAHGVRQPSTHASYSLRDGGCAIASAQRTLGSGRAVPYAVSVRSNAVWRR